MIIGSWIKLEVGKRYGTTKEEWLNDDNKKRHIQQPFLVLREATIDDWAKPETSESDRNAAKNGYFYEISID